MNIFFGTVKRLSNQSLLKYGLITNTTFGVILRGTGDLIQQNIEQKTAVKNKQPQQIINDNTIVTNTSDNWTGTTKKYDLIRTSNSSEF
jgi:hypothetical protein